jgi:hypothetical protein
VDVTFVFHDHAVGKYYPNNSRTGVVHQCKGPCIANEQINGLTRLGMCHQCLKDTLQLTENIHHR